MGFPRFGIGLHAINLRGTMPRSADTMSTPQLTNAIPPEFHFPLNQDKITVRKGCLPA